jgi:hypothetical protein
MIYSNNYYAFIDIQSDQQGTPINNKTMLFDIGYVVFPQKKSISD